MATGYSPEDIAATHELVETACARAGRDPRELDIWWYSEVTFAENIETGLAASLIWFAQWLVMGSMRGKRIPEAFKPKLRELTADSFHVSTRGKGKERGRAMVERAKQLGLFDWLVSRSSRLCGSVDEVRTRMAELRSLGVEQLVLFPYGCDGDMFNTIESLAEARR